MHARMHREEYFFAFHNNHIRYRSISLKYLSIYNTFVLPSILKQKVDNSIKFNFPSIRGAEVRLLLFEQFFNVCEFAV